MSDERPGSEIVTVDALLPQTLFIIPIQSSPVFPGMIAPLVLSKPKLIETAEHAIANRGIVGLVLTRDESQSEGEPLKGHYAFGTAVRIIKKLNTSDGGMTVLVHSLKRFRLVKTVREEPFVVAQIAYKDDILEKSIELDALTRSVVSNVKKLSETNPFFTEEIKLAMVNAPGPGALADLVAFALSLKKEDAQDFLETTVVRSRFEKLLYHLKREQEVADLQKKINEDVNQKIHRMQREFFLKEQLRSIKRELGGDEDGARSIDKYRERIEQSLPQGPQSGKITLEARKVALEEAGKLEMTAETSPEFNVIRNYLDWMLALPWGLSTTDHLDLRGARKILDEDHYGIAKVKDRILEFLAVRKLNPKARGSVLCLVGPPGVGKTSLGKSIARAMGRNFFRFSLGGMRDEAEIKGHRRTYIGAMPGKVLGALKRAGSQNPVLLLDEIDKLGVSFQGDPASALLEVLDPEQNNAFLDHYLDVPFDLSDVMFIVTANTTATIPTPLLDRMEVVELSGYTLEEKEQIARVHVIPREIERHGLKPEQIEIPRETLSKLILSYSREPGMRSLQQNIAAICRKVTARVVENPRLRKVKVEARQLYDFLGPERFENELARRTQDPGVVVGLAWTAMGGQILFVEATDVPRRVSRARPLSDRISAKEQPALPEVGYGQFKLTGQLGEVMSESAAIAYSYVKKKTRANKTARAFFDENDIHLHIPAGAIPKDGPSAGVTMATALLSLVTGRCVRPDVAMTGELSLVGKVLPVGGIREKVLAARRAGIRTVILPKQNRKDLKEIPAANLKGMKFVFADSVEDVFKAALAQ